MTAVVSLKPAHTVTEEELRSHMRRNLARYKVPKTIVVVGDVPKSAAGEIVRAEAKKLAKEIPPD